MSLLAFSAFSDLIHSSLEQFFEGCLLKHDLGDVCLDHTLLHFEVRTFLDQGPLVSGLS